MTLIKTVAILAARSYGSWTWAIRVYYMYIYRECWKFNFSEY